MPTQSLQAILDAEGGIVDRLYRNPPRTAANVFGAMMPAEVVRPEFTTWREEQRSWREGIALHDQSYHMHSLRVRGKDAVALFAYLGINGFEGFQPGAAKQFVACSPEGYVIGDGILYYLDNQDLLLVGNPSTTDWVQFNGQTGKFDVDVDLDPMWVLNKEKRRSFYRYQIEGPYVYELVERLHGSPLPDIKFFRSETLSIAGHDVRAMRHSMGGVPGLELSGPWDDREQVKAALLEQGSDLGIRRIGSLAYFSTVIESGWWAVPFSAVYTGDELRPYREWLSTNSAAVRMSLGGSFYSPRPQDYYATPWDLGYDRLIRFDHEFVGRAALEQMADVPHRRKVTLLWHPDDVLGIYARLLGDGPTALHIDLPVSATARLHYDKVLGPDGELAGFGTYPGYSYNERAMMSLGSIATKLAEPGTELTLIWGEDQGGARSTPLIEPHEQVEIRVTVAPVPISNAAQEYRAVLSESR